MRVTLGEAQQRLTRLQRQMNNVAEPLPTPDELPGLFENATASKRVVDWLADGLASITGHYVYGQARQRHQQRQLELREPVVPTTPVDLVIEVCSYPPAERLPLDLFDALEDLLRADRRAEWIRRRDGTIAGFAPLARRRIICRLVSADYGDAARTATERFPEGLNLYWDNVLYFSKLLAPIDDPADFPLTHTNRPVSGQLRTQPDIDEWIIIEPEELDDDDIEVSAEDMAVAAEEERRSQNARKRSG